MLHQLRRIDELFFHEDSPVLSVGDRDEVHLDQEAWVRQPRYTDHRAGGRELLVLGALETWFAHRFLQRIDIERKDAAHDDVVPARAGSFELDSQRIDDVLVLFAIIAGMHRLIFLVRRRLAGDEDEFAKWKKGLADLSESRSKRRQQVQNED